ncbi:ModD protein [Ethanoligenens harbinense]|uniref:Putative pyrophosphorylase ModD n=1 Tax=Ethanoligenens harbinense (strain DSM 18485 / JCM 12961 / CGMCC 1.5033 / YUAN-3) TaxID=663278 RepID=E6U4G6_ETHHY|nr:ModD protein [Ethanoligenens harbinense]ADU27773.1 modD protein [Ethanoligenens harbinense YUAN-3]AVQ96796.1 ModD protein [Ethanoligenens harbinense YUAN-3]AYF39458.1 ModD protein [Ethanoligenens harbinense]AYF42282.1 ModD protein [Ethanoligenens harbinense]QCN93037.1 ModD protein [Ethanoligenens harbinense]
MYIADETIDKIIKEDVPYLDLTTKLLGIGEMTGVIKYTSREHAVLCGTEEVVRIFKKLGIEPVKASSSGSLLQPSETFLIGKGRVADLHMAWRLTMNILEYSSGIATRTRNLLEKARAVNPDIELLSTRKLFPGTKELSIKAVVAGGGMPHRLGLSETILVFEQHLRFMGGIEGLLKNYAVLRKAACDKAIIVEVTTLEDAKKLCRVGVDGIQLDKIPPEELQTMVAEIRKMSDRVKLIATGGITDRNAEIYARTGVDALSTSSLYFGKPTDIGVVIEK